MHNHTNVYSVRAYICIIIEMHILYERERRLKYEMESSDFQGKKLTKIKVKDFRYSESVTGTFHKDQGPFFE